MWHLNWESHLNQLHEVLEIGFFVNSELSVFVDDAVVLHLPVAAHTQSVVAGEVGALAHQEQACLRGVKQPLGLVSRYLPVEPSGRIREELSHKNGPHQRRSIYKRNNNTKHVITSVFITGDFRCIGQ